MAEQKISNATAFKEAVCIDAGRVYDSCSDKDCLEDLQVYFTEGNEKAKRLSEKIQYSVVNKLQPKNKRTVKEGKNIYVLENADIPAVLIECGFISNPEECEKLSEKEYQKELSFAILCGIIEYNKEDTRE